MKKQPILLETIAPNQAVGSDPKSKLEERGQRLAAMDQQTGKLSNAAQDFKETIKAFNEKEAKKKWWQI